MACIRRSPGGLLHVAMCFPRGGEGLPGVCTSSLHGSKAAAGGWARLPCALPVMCLLLRKVSRGQGRDTANTNGAGAGAAAKRGHGALGVGLLEVGTGEDALRWAPAPLQPPLPPVSLLVAKTPLCVSRLTPHVLSPPRCGMLGVPIRVLVMPTLHTGGSAQKLGDFGG